MHRMFKFKIRIEKRKKGRNKLFTVNFQGMHRVTFISKKKKKTDCHKLT